MPTTHEKQVQKQQPVPKESSTTMPARIKHFLWPPIELYDPTGTRCRIPRALALIALQVITCSTVLVYMTPVYGSIPTYENVSALFSWWAVMMIMPWLCVSLLPFDTKKLQMVRIIVARWVVTLPLFLFPQSSVLGPKSGPLFTQTLGIVPVIFSGCLAFFESLTALLASRVDDKRHGDSYGTSRKRIIESFLSGCLTLALCRTTVPSCARFVSSILGWQAYWGYHIVSRHGLVRLASATYLVCEQMMLPRESGWRQIRRLVISTAVFELLCSVAHYTLVAPHDQMKILDSMDSITGYISILQGIAFPSIIMRNDHSLLGGVWLPDHKYPNRLPEPVYPVFCMLEAVRLVQCSSCQSGDGRQQPFAENALVIGLGVGTAPGALNAHGVNTSVVELDPAVIHFAKKHFWLSKSVKTINMDALAFATKALDEKQKYDYIIHDVFTGGAEPAQLFTYEFLSMLRGLLKPSGAIAINYAGDLKHESTRRILRTICTVFPQCRAYRDSKPPKSAAGGDDMVNMVVFAASDGSKWTFRAATQADFLGTQARRDFLPPQIEIGVGDLIREATAPEVLRNKDVAAFAKGQFESACNHWRIMQKVMRPSTWLDF